MPLDGPDNAGNFCILTPHKDAALRDLNAYRPYEISKTGHNLSFRNTFMLSTLRNSSRDGGTLRTVLNLLDSNELASIQRAKDAQPEVRLRTPDFGSQQPTVMKDVIYNKDVNEHAKLPGALSQPNSMTSTSRKRQRKTEPHGRVSRAPNQSKDISEASLYVKPVVRTSTSSQIHMQVSRSKTNLMDKSAIGVHAAEAAAAAFADLRAKRIYFVWAIDNGGAQCNLIHTFHGCKSLSGLLILFQQDSRVLPAAAAILKATKTWRMTYTTADAGRRVKLVHVDSEMDFDHLRRALARSSTSALNLFHSIDIEMKALSTSYGTDIID